MVGQKKEDHILGLGVLDNLPRPNAGTGINWTRLLVYLRSSSKPYIVIYSLPNSVLRKVRIFNRGKSLTRRGATWGVFFFTDYANGGRESHENRVESQPPR